MVVDDAEDLGLGAVGELPVRGLQLPPVVGLAGLEPDIGAAWPLARLRGDKPAAGQDPPDRRGGWRAAVPLGQVEGDRRCPGSQAPDGQGLAQLDDPFLQLR